jgi:serine/threonine-protein kinase RsbW
MAIRRWARESHSGRTWIASGQPTDRAGARNPRTSRPGRGYLSRNLETDRYERRALAQPEAIAVLRTALVSHARSLGADAETCEAVQLAVSEALTNVVIHAYPASEPGEMTVQAWTDHDDRLTVRVLDEGQGLVPSTESPGLGLGLGLMAQMADDFRIANREGTPGTTVSLRFTLNCSKSRSGSEGARS